MSYKELRPCDVPAAFQRTFHQSGNERRGADGLVSLAQKIIVFTCFIGQKSKLFCKRMKEGFIVFKISGLILPV